jgi:predicted metal-dependent peptidase
MNDKQEVRVKRAHITMMKAKDTAAFTGVMLLGKSSVEDGNFSAYTDGVNKKYCRSFIEKLPDEELRGLVLHENLHVAFKHLVRGKKQFKEDAYLTNAAADFVNNDVIVNIKATISTPKGNELLVKLPKGGLYDPMFHGWSFPEVYNYLKKKVEEKQKENEKGEDKDDDNEGDNEGGKDGSKEGQNNNPQGGDPLNKQGKEYADADDVINGHGKQNGTGFDEHDFDGQLTEEEAKKLVEEIDRKIREGGMLAGRMGADLPRSITEGLEPRINWRDVLREFFTSAMKGKEEMTWRRLNRRHLANDVLYPSTEDETVGKVIFAIDTSGSISDDDLGTVAKELASLCTLLPPEEVVVLWWDTEVHGKQIFDADSYNNIENLLKPQGGGGTFVGCVSKYIAQNSMSAECVVVFTDGYVENNVEWDIDLPTLWIVTLNNQFNPPKGKKVMFDE